MAFSDNLHYLRKRDKITQEELADELNVSRQSVSKWETGEAYPETDKLILLCDKFSVSLDALLRGDVTAGENEEYDGGESDGKKQTVAVDRDVFVRHMNGFSRGISLGVFLILAGVAVCVALGGWSTVASAEYSNLIAVMGAVAVLLAVAASVFLFVSHGISHERFIKLYPAVDDMFPPEQTEKFLRRFSVSMACLVSGIILDVVYLVVMSSLLDSKIIHGGDDAYCYVTASFLLVLAFIVGGIVYLGIQRSKCVTSEYNSQNRNELNPTPRSRLKGALCGAVMMTATALFLVLGFVWNKWHPGWIVFPIGGILCGVISSVIGIKDGNDKQ